MSNPLYTKGLNTVNTPSDITYTFSREVLGYSVNIKLPRMRASKNFSIYPISKNDTYIYCQAENSCFQVNIENGETIYTNKGACPMSYYLQFKPTYKTTLPMQFVEDVITTLRGDKRYDLENGTVCTSLCGLTN